MAPCREWHCRKYKMLCLASDLCSTISDLFYSQHNTQDVEMEHSNIPISNSEKVSGSLIEKGGGFQSICITNEKGNTNIVPHPEADTLMLEMGIHQLSIQVNSENETAEKERLQLPKKCITLQERNTVLCNELRQAKEQCNRLTSELKQLRDRAKISCDRIKQISEKFPKRVANALMSNRAKPKPLQFHMTKSTGHRGPHRVYHQNFGVIMSGCWVDLNGELAWINVYLVSQSERMSTK